MAIDSHAANVVLLLPMTGANNSTTFTDYSNSARIVTPSGNAKISSNKTLFDLNTATFDGTGDYLSVTGVALSGDFCIEAKINPVAVASSFMIFDSRPGDFSTTGFVFYVRSTGKLTFGTGDPFVATEGTTNVSNNVFSDVALTRSGSTVRCFLGGALQFTVTNSNSFSTTAWKIGHQWNASGTLSAGNIAQLRITNGVARYTASYTPPTQLVISKSPIILDGLWVTISGTCLKVSSGGADLVAIYDATTRELIAVAIPNSTTGAWTANVPAGSYYAVYTAASCQPICHGPYTVSV